jgi:hypothetical protein
VICAIFKQEHEVSTKKKIDEGYLIRLAAAAAAGFFILCICVVCVSCEIDIDRYR